MSARCSKKVLNFWAWVYLHITISFFTTVNPLWLEAEKWYVSPNHCWQYITVNPHGPELQDIIILCHRQPLPHCKPTLGGGIMYPTSGAPYWLELQDIIILCHRQPLPRCKPTPGGGITYPTSGAHYSALLTGWSSRRLARCLPA